MFPRRFLHNAEDLLIGEPAVSHLTHRAKPSTPISGVALYREYDQVLTVSRRRVLSCIRTDEAETVREP